MKAIAYTQHGLPIDDPAALVEVELPTPEPGPRDLLVAVRAIAVNPVDTKVRASSPVQAPRILGWDAVGTVTKIGSEVTLFQPGDVVYYAGSITRPGSYAEYALVDERIAARKPSTLSDAEAAALPLTTITAWELLFDRLRIARTEARDGGTGEHLLVTAAAGGVGSMLIQLARQLTGLTVIGTASRPDTREWVKSLGAHHVIDRSRPLKDELGAIGIDAVEHVASLSHTGQHYPQLVDVLAPQGHLAVIDDPATLDVMPMKRKALSLHWEFMFARPMFETKDMIRQHELLTEVAQMIDADTLRTTLGEHFGKIDAANLRRAHALIESNRARGKIVLEGF
ncbi:zinc-binding alcohol dehydrogenase family protein [Paracidovorax citrulli]